MSAKSTHIHKELHEEGYVWMDRKIRDPMYLFVLLLVLLVRGRARDRQTA